MRRRGAIPCRGRSAPDIPSHRTAAPASTRTHTPEPGPEVRHPPMIPLRDDVPSHTVPVVTCTLIAINAGVFLYEANLPDRELERLFDTYATTPLYTARGERPSGALLERVDAFRKDVADAGSGTRPTGQDGRRRRAADTPPSIADQPWWVIVADDGFKRWLARRGETVDDFPPESVPWAARLLPLLTCMFLHGGWMHLIGNMWFLYLFGDNVEDGLGKGRFVAFYLAGGVLGSLAHAAVDTASPIPTVGASGAISAVMGGYMLMYPQARVLALVPLGRVMQMIELPALMFIGLWFVMQAFQGVASLRPEASGGGTAWWAHIGGFVFGVLWVVIVPKSNERGSWIDQFHIR